MDNQNFDPSKDDLINQSPAGITSDHQGYIPPQTAQIPTKKKGIRPIAVVGIVIGALAVLIAVGAFGCVSFVNAVTGGFKARSINTSVSANPAKWQVSGKDINGTAEKTFTADEFIIEIDGNGSLSISMFDAEDDSLIASEDDMTTGIYSIETYGKTRIQVTANDFSGAFVIYEE